jgi:hypothetical protein
LPDRDAATDIDGNRLNMQIDLPHQLGRVEAKRRIQSRIGELAGHMPGGVAEVSSAWPEEYRMALDVAAMGQQVAATIEVEERIVRLNLQLPMMLRFASGALEAVIQRKGSELLLGEPTKGTADSA